MRGRSSRLNRKTKKKKSIVYIFTEGDITEPRYLKDWGNYFCKKNELKKSPNICNFIELESSSSVFTIIKSNSKSASRTVYETAEKWFSKKDPEDFIFIAIDDDDRAKKDMNNIFQKCNSFEKGFSNKKINCIFSNRSVEFWALLHFIQTNRAYNKKNLETELRKYLPDYHDKTHKIFDFSLMKDKTDTAIKNSISIRNQHNNTGEPYKQRSTTNMDELIIFLREFLIKK
ncbi:MAG: RloB family protein [Alphaproteobacteria bacterium]|nr:MAG: hypothetical protein B6I23_03320 [Rickettsiaceae bacterium 4572_127]